MDIAAMMPCRGRPEQTVANVRRLLATAGHPFQLICMVDRDKAVFDALLAAKTGAHVMMQTQEDMRGYWWALANATHNTDAAHLVNLANDLLPGRNWLARGVAAYKARFGSMAAPGLMGFNDGLHGPEHSSHFLISRGLLERCGGWPTWYSHNFGDTELCRRAQADGCYGKAAWAVLFHDHLENGRADDAVYQEGRATYERDAKLFEARRKAGWPPVTSASARTTAPIGTARAVWPIGASDTGG
jgi:hypothetical protein